VIEADGGVASRWKSDLGLQTSNAAVIVLRVQSSA